jgi:hypothetical protein
MFLQQLLWGETIAMSIPWPRQWACPDLVEWNGVGNAHSRTAVVILGGVTLFLKVYGLPEKEDTLRTRAQAEQLVADIKAYRLALQMYGMRTPQSSGYSVEEYQGRFYAYVLDSYEGWPLCEDTATAPILMDQVLGLMSGLFRERPNVRIPAGIDPKPSNFVVDGRGVITYVDLVWPLLDHILEEIHPEMRAPWDFRYFLKTGVCLNWLIQFARHQPTARTALLQQIAGFLGNQSDLLPQFNSLPGVAPLGQGLAMLRGDEIPPWNVDALRAIGVQLAESRHLDQRFLSEVFALTRTNPHEPLPGDRIRSCRELLLRHI